ncbi:unnamed protein product [Amoebophrya sp. A25]|nr:unnamed protein product [Amoebophrya sp. A25]|eukprot:GSA25T00009314001.1
MTHHQHVYDSVLDTLLSFGSRGETRTSGLRNSSIMEDWTSTSTSTSSASSRRSTRPKRRHGNTSTSFLPSSSYQATSTPTSLTQLASMSERMHSIAKDSLVDLGKIDSLDDHAKNIVSALEMYAYGPSPRYYGPASSPEVIARAHDK